MRAAMALLALCGLGALDWAALHDILRGEPNLMAEYGMLAASVVAGSGVVWLLSRRRHGGERRIG